MQLCDVMAVNGGLTDKDLATLADWANAQARNTPNQDWKRAYSLLREGADLLLRRRAQSSVAETLSGSGDGTIRVELGDTAPTVKRRAHDSLDPRRGE